MKLSRILALLLVVILILMIAATLIVAFIGGEETRSLFRFLIFADLVFPVIIYGFILISKQRK